MQGNIGELLATTTRRLSGHTDTPQLDAQVLLAHVLKSSRTWLLAHSASEPDGDATKSLETLIRRLESGEPLAYIVRHREFFGLDFDLTPDVMIPRPETELLVEQAIAWLQVSPSRHFVADIGTGSGCIAVSIAVRVPAARVLATDISEAALRIASSNAHKFHVENRIEFAECDILPEPAAEAPTIGQFDLACANLPYIPSSELEQLPVRMTEPKIALDGGPDGLDLFRRCLRLLPSWMAPASLILFEIEASKGTAVLSLAYDAFQAAAMHLHQDLAGQDRLLEIQLPAN
jgi:release factor glutamine methyltransferase